MTTDLSTLQRRLNYQFQDINWLELALTHRSAKGAHNERLEFLGDALLGAWVAEQLFFRFPEADEGTLSRLRARVVKGTALAKIGHRLALGQYLRLGPGELKSGGHRRDSILADTVEALIGGVFCDGGAQAAESVMASLLGAEIEQLKIADAQKDPKTRLQEWLQRHGAELPVYRLLREWGEDHAPHFLVECEAVYQGKAFRAQAENTSRKRAEQNAAEQVLSSIEEQIG